MGPVGISIGLGLKSSSLDGVEVLGTSGDRTILNQGKKIGAFDTISSNLRSALNGAGMVILDTHFGETREILEAIGPILEKGCVVTDTGTFKVKMMEWTEEYLPENVEFVGGRPIPKVWMKSIDDASPTAFQDAFYCIVAPSKVDQAALKSVIGLAEILGSKPLFLDEHEHDSYAAAASQLPLLLSSTLVNSLSKSPAWREIAQLAGGEFEQISALASGNSNGLGSAFLENPEDLVRWIDHIIENLLKCRELVESGSDEINEFFDRALDEWAKWKAGTIASQQQEDLPGVGETMSGFFFGRRVSKRFKGNFGNANSDKNRH